MHYYQHHIGDYNRDTAALSMTEHGAYRLLMDAYYVTERPLPLDNHSLYRICRAMTKAEKDAVAMVICLFFAKSEEGYAHKRIITEIEAYRKKAEKNRENGQNGGRKPNRKPKPNPVGSQTVSETEPKPNPNQEPLTMIHSATHSARGSDWPTVEEVNAHGAIVMAPVECCEKFWNEMEACGWVNRHGQPVTDWRPLLRNYATNWKANEHRLKQQARGKQSPAPGILPPEQPGGF